MTESDDEIDSLLPEDMPGQTASELLDLLYRIADLIESRYFAQIRGHHHDRQNAQRDLWD